MKVRVERYTFADLCAYEKDLAAKVSEFLAALPQSNAIKEEDAARWIEKTSNLPLRVNENQQGEQVAIDELFWHLNRLRGLGGSEIGDVIAVPFGEKNGFNTALDIFRAKRMIDYPLQGNSFMRRGKILEDVIANLMTEDFEVHRDQSILDQIKANSGNIPGFEFLVGNADDAVRDDDGQIYIIDYKAPTEVPSKPPFAYVAQLHHYDLILGRGEQSSAELADVFFNYAKGELDVHYVKKDANLANAIKQYGAEFMALLCDPAINVDSLPEKWTASPIYDTQITDDDVAAIPTLEGEQKALRVINEVVEKIKADIGEKTKQAIVTPYGIKVNAKDYAKEFTVRQMFRVTNEAELLHLMQSKGVNPDDFKKLKNDFDHHKVTEFLINQGQDPDSFKTKELDAQAVFKWIMDSGLDPLLYVSSNAAIFPKNSKEVKASIEQIREQIAPLLTDSIEQLLGMVNEVEVDIEMRK